MNIMRCLETYLRETPAPAYPFDINSELANKGKSIFGERCATCHDSDKTGTSIPIEEIGTDRYRLDSWNKQAAIAANKKVKTMGITRTPMTEEDLTGFVETVR